MPQKISLRHKANQHKHNWGHTIYCNQRFEPLRPQAETIYEKLKTNEPKNVKGYLQISFLITRLIVLNIAPLMELFCNCPLSDNSTLADL